MTVISPFTFFILMVILGAYLYSTATGTFNVRLPSRSDNRVVEVIRWLKESGYRVLIATGDSSGLADRPEVPSA